jgi:hypothetical protein
MTRAGEYRLRGGTEASKFSRLFTRSESIIGVIHLPALPGWQVHPD